MSPVTADCLRADAIATEIRPCMALIRRRMPCPSAASWRMVVTCPTCALDGIRLMCQRHTAKAIADAICCQKCWEVDGRFVTLGVVAVEPL